MNERAKQLALQALKHPDNDNDGLTVFDNDELQKFAQLIVKEVCGMMEQAEDDAYHCFEPSERPTEYIEWLRYWQERFTKHFGVEQ